MLQVRELSSGSEKEKMTVHIQNTGASIERVG